MQSQSHFVVTFIMIDDHPEPTASGIVSTPSSDTSFFVNSVDGFGGGLSTDSALLVLDSLFPLAKLLPGLTKEKNSSYYYVQCHGQIERSELESLYNDAGRIGSLTLGGEPDSEAFLLHVLARIAQLQDPNKALFPLLHRLRIIGRSSSLHFLHLFLSSALTTIELTAIPVDDPCYSSVLSFLECATHQAPNLSTLILGPGLIPVKILDVSLRYKNLRCLKLLDVEISITGQLLQDIGSLRHLEHFYIRDNGASTYGRPSVIPAATEHVVVPGEPAEDPILIDRPESPEGGPRNKVMTRRSPSPSEWSQRSIPEPTTPKDEPMETIIVESLPIPDVATQTVDSRLFPVLQSLVIFGYFSLIEDLVAKVSSSDLRMLVIDFTTSLKPIQTGNLKTGLKSTKGPKPTSSLKPKIQAPPSPQISTDEIASLMRLSTRKWINSLEAVLFSNTHTPTTVSMPSDLFKDLLLCRPEMKHLGITGIGIDSIDTTLNCLKEVPNSKLKTLHLPIHSTAPTISPTRLRYIAEACPHLKSLRCRFKHLSNIVPVSPPMSHSLEELSVTNERAHPKQRRSFDIARYLDSMFPNIKSIVTHDGEGNNAEQWRFIFDLVELCQAARNDDKNRRLALERDGGVFHENVVLV